MPDFAPRPMQLTFEKPGNYILYIYIFYIYIYLLGVLMITGELIKCHLYGERVNDS